MKLKRKFIFTVDDSIECDGLRTQRVINPGMVSSADYYLDNGETPTLEIRFVGSSREESFHGEVATKIWKLILSQGYEDATDG